MSRLPGGADCLLRDFPGLLKERGADAPASSKHALTFQSEALGIEWPLTNQSVLSAATVASNEYPRHAPATDVVTVRKLAVEAGETMRLYLKNGTSHMVL